MDVSLLDRGPVIVAVAGPNGAGKSTFYDAFLRPAGLRFINADALARELGLDAYAAAELAGRLRGEMLARGESFAFETVLSDPVGEKVEFLRRAAAERGYAVVLCFIGLNSVTVSDERVAMRVSQGGHDVPTEKLVTRFPRTLANLRRALVVLPCVLVYENSDLAQPFRFIAECAEGRLVRGGAELPEWFPTLDAPMEGEPSRP